MKIDLQGGSKSRYYSQLNNSLDPYSACQVTAMVMGLDIAGFGLSPIETLYCDFTQPEDKLRWFMLTDGAVKSFCERSHPGGNLPPPEWADVMCYAVNLLYGKLITYFHEPLTMDVIEKDLRDGLPLYTSMRYPRNVNFSGKPSPVSGHIVLITGIDGESVYVNDPYKNHLTGEKDGFNNRYRFDEFSAHNKGYAIRYRRV